MDETRLLCCNDNLLCYFLDMDTDFAGGLIVNPSDVKVEPPSPSSTPSPGPAPSIQMKCEPDLVIKQEMTQTKPLQQQSVLKQPTILITSGTRTSSNTTRLLVPKLPTTTTVKLENGDRWRVGGAGGVVGPTKILVSGGHTGLKSSTRRAIDSHLISNNTVGNWVLIHTYTHAFYILQYQRQTHTANAKFYQIPLLNPN